MSINPNNPRNLLIRKRSGVPDYDLKKDGKHNFCHTCDLFYPVTELPIIGNDCSKCYANKTY